MIFFEKFQVREIILTLEFHQTRVMRLSFKHQKYIEM